MLKNTLEFLIRRDHVIDCSGRAFSDISGFEYSLWALDMHMREKMLLCLPSYEENKEIKIILFEQYEHVINKGITYTIDGVTTTEHHFDFQNHDYQRTANLLKLL